MDAENFGAFFKIILQNAPWCHGSIPCDINGDKNSQQCIISLSNKIQKPLRSIFSQGLIQIPKYLFS